MLTRPSLVPGFSNPLDRMDGSYGQQPSSSEGIPPLAEIKTVGALHYTDQAKTPADVGINGSIDKGFFLADNEWTCYRRNYFSCVCSYTLTPYMSGIPIELTMPGTHPVPVCGFAMGISAVVAENDTHSIGLVQHTPKRDKGPIKIPSRVPLMAKQDGAPRSMAYFNNGQPGAGETIYPDGWVPANTEGPNPGTLTEWTFERVQFKQATQNNGKRRAAQQYYQLMIELYANTGTPANPNFVKIAYRKSSKMIVRGRSPGHYQNERRGSSVHPPPSGTPSQSYGVMGGVRDFNSGQLMQPYGYDSHASVYGTARHTHHTLPAEALIPPEDEKAIESTKAYQYYPGSIYPSHDNRIDMWSHNDASPESMAAPHTLSTPLDMNDKVKDEYETAGATAHTNAGGASGSTTTNNASSSSSPLPRLMQPQTLGGTDHPRSCRPFDGKPTSTGYYPHHHMTPPTMGVGVTMQ